MRWLLVVVAVVQQADDRRLFGRTVAQALTEAAGDGGDIQSTFDAIQPPGHRADRLRSQLDVRSLPIVGRRGVTFVRRMGLAVGVSATGAGVGRGRTPAESVGWRAVE